MQDHLINMKNLVDKLKLARNPISNSHIIIQTLNGFYSKYNHVELNILVKYLSVGLTYNLNYLVLNQELSNSVASIISSSMS